MCFWEFYPESQYISECFLYLFSASKAVVLIHPLSVLVQVTTKYTEAAKITTAALSLAIEKCVADADVYEATAATQCSLEGRHSSRLSDYSYDRKLKREQVSHVALLSVCKGVVGCI